MNNAKQKTKQSKNYTMEQVNKVEFNPDKNYQWSTDAMFSFSGKEFEYAFNEMLNFINTPFGVQSSVRMLALYNMLETKFKIAVLDGMIKEVSNEEVAKILDKTQQVNETNLAVEG